MSIRSQLKYFPIILIILVSLLAFDMGLTMVRTPGFGPQRAPSSIGPVADSAALIDLGCGEKVDTISTESHQIRIRGCISEIGVPAEIVNTTTGFIATVLDFEDFFTTDYFPLNAGTNTIHVIYKIGEGKTKLVEYKVLLK